MVLRLPAHVVLPAVGLLAYAFQLASIATGPPGMRGDVERVVVHAAAIDGVLSALTPLAIVFGAVLFFKTMEASGALAVLTSRLRALTPDPIAQLLLVGWAFSFLVEGLSGFGTPAALAAPILVGLGFPSLRVASMCLVMNSVPVSFGAVGTPTWFGLGGLGLSPGELGEIGWRTALVHAAAAPVIAVVALRILVPWHGARGLRPRIGFILLAVASSVGPYLAAARFSVEFPSIVGGLMGLLGGAALARGRVGLPPRLHDADLGPHAALSVGGASTRTVARTPGPGLPPISLGRAALPLLGVLILLTITRVEALGLKALLTTAAGAVRVRLGPFGEAWVSPALVIGLRDILGTDTAWQMPVLYVPFILPFVVIALAAMPVLRMDPAVARAAWRETVQRLAKPALALMGALVLVKILMVGGERSPAMLAGHALAGAVGTSWPYFASLLGAFGAFLSGSNTVSNLTFAPIQAAIAGTLALDLVTVLALQSAGGAMGNMVSIHNIVAVAAVVGLAERSPQPDTTGAAGDRARQEAQGRPDAESPGVIAVLKLTIAPMLIYAGIAAIMAAAFAVAYRQ